MTRRKCGADGLGSVKTDTKRVDFDLFPWESFAIWMLTQMKRRGQLKGEIDYAAIAKQVFQADAARLTTHLALNAPTPPSKSFTLMGKTFDPTTPENYVKSFAIRRAV